MIRFKFRVITRVTSTSLLKSNVLFSMNFGKDIEARLHTATSSGAVYSIISVQRFDERIVPKFF